MVQATKATSTTCRRFLAAAPAALAIGATTAAAASQGVTPDLAKMIEEWKVADAEFKRLNAIDDAARDHYCRIAPEIPDRILAETQGEAFPHYPHAYDGHLRYVCRRISGPSPIPAVLKSSWWRKEVGDWKRGDIQPTWLMENIRIAEEFEAGDVAAYEKAGCALANDNMEAAGNLSDELEREVEQFAARSWADVVAIARVSKNVNDRDRDHVFRESWDDLIANILAVAEKQGA